MHTYVHVPEVFFHYIWKHKLLKNDLKTVAGDRVTLIHSGIHNPDAGPDFLCAGSG